ncbi:MAG: hypothetical protein RSG07_03380 [Erysipelotrichaceae bacterium]
MFFKKKLNEEEGWSKTVFNTLLINKEKKLLSVNNKIFPLESLIDYSYNPDTQIQSSTSSNIVDTNFFNIWCAYEDKGLAGIYPMMSVSSRLENSTNKKYIRRHLIRLYFYTDKNYYSDIEYSENFKGDYEAEEAAEKLVFNIIGFIIESIHKYHYSKIIELANPIIMDNGVHSLCDKFSYCYSTNILTINNIQYDYKDIFTFEIVERHKRDVEVFSAATGYGKVSAMVDYSSYLLEFSLNSNKNDRIEVLLIDKSNPIMINYLVDLQTIKDIELVMKDIVDCNNKTRVNTSEVIAIGTHEIYTNLSYNLEDKVLIVNGRSIALSSIDRVDHRANYNAVESLCASKEDMFDYSYSSAKRLANENKFLNDKKLTRISTFYTDIYLDIYLNDSEVITLVIIGVIKDNSSRIYYSMLNITQDIINFINTLRSY